MKTTDKTKLLFVIIFFLLLILLGWFGVRLSIIEEILNIYPVN